MLFLAPHMLHRMQLSDFSFFMLFKTAYEKECYLLESLLGKITLPSLVKKAFTHIVSISKGESGIRSTDIFPVNPGVLTDEDLIAGEIIQLEIITEQDSCESLPATSTASKPTQQSIPGTLKEINLF